MQQADDNRLNLNQILHAIAELLPSQGPIDVFIHHNTLHAFEGLPFESAVKEAAEVYGAEAFLPEQRYLDEYRSGRISEHDLEAVISQAVSDEPALASLSLREVIKKFLVVSPPVEGFQEVKWLLRESPHAVRQQHISGLLLKEWIESHQVSLGRMEALHRLNAEAAESLEKILRDIPKDDSITESERVVLWAAALVASAEVWRDRPVPPQDSASLICDDLINPLVIRFCEEYLDLGFSTQLMPARREGMLGCFLKIVEGAHFGVPSWLGPLRTEAKRYQLRSNNFNQLLEELLSERGLSQDQHYDFLLREALALKGWAGYVSLVEHRPDMLHGQHDEIQPRLIEYLIIRLLLRKYVERSHLYRSRLLEASTSNVDLQRLDDLYCFAYHVLILFTSLGMGEALLLDSGAVKNLLNTLRDIDQTTRRTLWHLAYENNLYSRALNALTLKGVWNAPTHKGLDAQFVFCIDDREESIRRHLESLSERYQTFGTAGFFGVDANYTMMSGTSAPYCPVIIKPTHAIREIPRQGHEKDLSRYRRKQAAWFKLSGYVNRGSGSIIHNFLLSLAGCVALVPMLLGVIAPRTLRFMGKLFGSDPTIPPELHELQIGVDPTASNDLPGYTLEEMADRVTAVLKGIGLVKDFAPLVLLIGHGSSSRNNPLRSAYDCGACGGRPGRINARAFSLMANNPKVRELVREKSGISIPSDTYFLGAFHNTCSDQIEYFDMSLIPSTLHGSFDQVRQHLLTATKLNAFERCRRFAQAGVTSIDQAAEEALSRSFMLAEARPEYGHATNALCIVGPRHFSKDIFFDRRSFLVSYDHKVDPEANILLGILRAVVPVCGGINLEYLFSAMDNEVYGAGTKLPHNIVSLVGIMNGTSSDLRTGLPTQMIEIHEPVRLLLVIVSTRTKLEKVIASDEAISRSFRGRWINVVLANSDTQSLEWRLPDGSYRAYEPSQEQVPVIHDYRKLFTGRTGHLPFGAIAREHTNA